MKPIKRCIRSMVPFAVAAILLILFFNVLSSFVSREMTAETSMTDPLKISGGLISGIAIGSGVHVYKGIPYAAPPVGSLRWKPPQPAKYWDGVRTCASYGPVCPQPNWTNLTGKSYSNASEDCLYLNVWTPAKGAGEQLPVMVWFHGGAFMVGSASDDLYDGGDLARKGVVVVTTNYRLGPFGFFAHPLLSRESGRNASGNYGLLDQIAVLEWVRDNIRAFGGDPKRVTIFGESAGGRSVALLMVSPLSKGLFHRAILESRTVYTTIQDLRKSWYGWPSMETVGERITKELGTDKANNPLAALRAKKTEEILAASKPALPGLTPALTKGNPFEPIVDGWVIPDDPSDLFDAGKQHKVPIMAGSNADEATLFFQNMDFNNLRRCKNIIQYAFPKYTDEIFRIYPMNTSKEARVAMNGIFGDMSSTAPIRRTVRRVADIGANAWLYYFTHVRSDERGRELGAYHGSEIRFVFNNLRLGKSPVEAVDRRVADAMSGSWVRFAATGNPNGQGLTEWPSYNKAEEPCLDFGAEIVVKHHLKKASCDLFEKVEADRRAHKFQSPVEEKPLWLWLRNLFN